MGLASAGSGSGSSARIFRFGVRTLLRDRVFAVSAILTLGLATGATTAVFSLVNGLLLRPLPFPAAERLVSIHGRNWSEDRGASPDPMTAPVGSLEIEALQHSRSFEAIAGYSASTRHLESSGGVERVRIVAADRAFFDVLEVGPIVGRTFRSDDPPSVAVISERAWRQRFGGDPRVVERTVTLDGVVFSIVGVMPDSFEFPYYRANSSVASMPSDGRTEVWVPLPPLRAAAGGKPRGGRVEVVARLEPQTTLHQAGAELAVMAGQIEAEHYRGTPTRSGMRASALVDDVIAPVRSSLWLLFAAVGLVLAAACANVASLLLARMLRRAREVVTRAALGASGLRLVRQFLAESLVLSPCGWRRRRRDCVVGHGSAARLLSRPAAAAARSLARLAGVRVPAAGLHRGRGARWAGARPGGSADESARRDQNGGRTRDHGTADPARARRARHRRSHARVRPCRRRSARSPRNRSPAQRADRHERRERRRAPLDAAHDPRRLSRDRRAGRGGCWRAGGWLHPVSCRCRTRAGWRRFEVRGRPASTAERLTTDLRYVTPGYFRGRRYTDRGRPQLHERRYCRRAARRARQRDVRAPLLPQRGCRRPRAESRHDRRHRRRRAQRRAR